MANLQQDLHLTDYINVLRRRQNIIITFFITVVVVVTAGSFIMRPVYRATATLLIDTESPDILSASGAVMLESQSYYTYKEYYQSQKEILGSRAIARRVFHEFNLGATKKYARAKDPIKEFLKTIRVEPIRDTRLLKLNVDNRDQNLAAEIANRIAQVYVRRNLYYISRDELMNLLKNEYLKLETKLSEYNKIYKHKHPRMIRLKEEIKETVKRIESVKDSAFDFDITKRSLGEEGGYALEGLKANNVSIEDPAEVPKVPLKPKKRLNVLLAVIVGLFGGVGLAFFFEYLEDTVKSIDDLGKLGEWPFLGAVPAIDAGGKMSEFKKDMLTHLEPKSPTAEAYKAIRTSIFFSSTEEQPLKALAVTSPGPQEGKTTTLCNLGIAIAQSGKRVLLVDSDMRKPRLHGIFKKKNEKGLSNFLCLQAKFEGVVQKTDIDNISLVTGGAYPPNPSELIISHRMREFIDSARAKYDYVLFDTPPVAVVTDAVVLSKVIDGVIVVIEGQKTSKRVLPRIFQILNDAKVKVIGTLLNRISLKNRNYQYYYYYHRYYGK